PIAPRVAKLIEKRLGRKLEPFDIWYAGFKPRGSHTEAELDEIVRRKYPTAEAYKKDIPNLLVKLGFSKEKANFLASNIVVDPARGSGHAMGAARRGDQAHLRTRVEKDGMNYKALNIAVHEMAHNCEQPIFGQKDVTLLAVYSHMINSFLYLPDYPIGHMIAFQIKRQMEKAGSVGPEFERMTKMGNVAPDIWMKNASGCPVGPEALLAETEKALAQVPP